MKLRNYFNKIVSSVKKAILYTHMKLCEYAGDIISFSGIVILCVGLYFLCGGIGLPLSIFGLELFILGIAIDQDKG